MASVSNVGAPVSVAKADPGPPVPLEPDHELPTVQPYRPGVGGVVGTAAGAIGGGLVGLTFGGLIGLAADATHGFGGPAIAVGLGVAGLALGGIGIYSWNKERHETRENAKIQAEHGTATLQFARTMMSSYDHDHDGRIDIENSTGLDSMDERVRTESRSRSRQVPEYDFFDDEWETRTERWTETRGISASQVWESADVDPRDRIVTDVELATMMSKFDADRNGTLTTPEQEAFRAAHPVIVDDWRD